MKQILMCFALSLFATTVFAKKAKFAEPPILAGTEITVLGHNTKNGTLTIQMNKEPAVGPNYAKPASLVQAIDIADELDRKKFAADPSRFVGGIYVLKHNLALEAP